MDGNRASLPTPPQLRVESEIGRWGKQTILPSNHSLPAILSADLLKSDSLAPLFSILTIPTPRFPFIHLLLPGNMMRPSTFNSIVRNFLPLTALVTALGFAQDASPQLQLFSPDAFPMLSPKCVNALTSNLSCNFMETGNFMYQLTRNLSTDYLQRLCTRECADSIDVYRSNVERSCIDDVYFDRANATDESYTTARGAGSYSPIVVPDYYFTNYKQRCLKNR